MVASIFPNLHLWDEQFHALVAKNMIENPFRPMLYSKPILPYNEFDWSGNHIWLHKQPLFLWQMALSMKIFGVNVIALRLPSVIMSSLLIFIIYRIGKITLNKTIAYYAALLYALSYFSIELSSGITNTDHNDVAFLFYVTASIWAWIEYENVLTTNRKKLFLVLIGLFSGAAVLVKWLTGILVFSGWGMSVLLAKNKRFEVKYYLPMLLSFSIALLVFLPWQIYIINVFPVISAHEYAFNTKHFFEVIEGHGGTFSFHFEKMKLLYGIDKIVVILSLILLFFQIKNKTYKIALITYTVLIYLFFSIAATKMILFTYVVSSIVFFAFGNLIYNFFNTIVLHPKYSSNKIMQVIYTTVILGIISGLNLNIEGLQEKFTLWKKSEDSFFYHRLNTAETLINLDKTVPNIENTIIFNCKNEDNIPIMFFSQAIAAYCYLPDEETINTITQKGHEIAIFKSKDLPKYITNSSDIKLIKGYYHN